MPSHEILYYKYIDQTQEIKIRITTIEKDLKNAKSCLRFIHTKIQPCKMFLDCLELYSVTQHRVFIVSSYTGLHNIIILSVQMFSKMNH